VFNGIYSGYYAGGTFMPGSAGVEITVLGHAHKVGPTFGYGIGIGVGYSYTFGSSTVMSSSIKNCGCGK